MTFQSRSIVTRVAVRVAIFAVVGTVVLAIIASQTLTASHVLATTLIFLVLNVAYEMLAAHRTDAG